MTNILNDVAFYNDIIQNGITQVEETYKILLNNYFIDILEKKKIKNNGYFKFIFYRGVQTINHIFLLLFIYIKNLPIIGNECKKAYFYYIEFIEQIMDEDYNFLHLSSVEATLFVYKKTIYEINQNYRKSNSILNPRDSDFIESLRNKMEKQNKRVYKLLEECINKEYSLDEIKNLISN